MRPASTMEDKMFALLLLSPAGEMAINVICWVFMLLIAIGLVYRVWGHALPFPRKFIVPAFHTGVVLNDGKPERVVQPGRYWLSHGRSMIFCDMRPNPFQIASQNMIASDGMGVQISLGGEQKVSDPAAFVSENSNSFSAFYMEMRLALRNAVSELDSHAVLTQQSEITSRMQELLIPRAAQLGIELVHLEVFEAMPLGRMTHIE